MAQTVTDAQGAVHSFPDEATPAMMATALGVKPEAPQASTLGYVAKRALAGLIDLGKQGAVEGQAFADSAQAPGQSDVSAQTVLNAPAGDTQASQWMYGNDDVPAPNVAARYAGNVGYAFGSNPAVSLLAPGFTTGGALASEGASDINKATGSILPDWAARGIGDVAGGLGYGGAKALLKPATQAAARAFSPNAVESQGADLANKALSADINAQGIPPSQIGQRVAEANSYGVPLTVADAAGENTQGLLGKIYRQPGEARQEIRSTLDARDAGAGERITNTVDQALTGGSWGNPDEIVAAQRAAAAPAYTRAFANDAYSARLQQFLDDPIMKQGMARGLQMERLDATAEGRPFDQGLSQGLDIGPNGEWKSIGTPNMRVLDAGKRGLDAIVADARNPVTGTLSQEGRSVNGFLQSYLKELDRLNPDYATARAAYGGPARSLDAIRRGAVSLNLSPSDAASQLAQLPPNEQALFRQGASTAYAGRIADTSLGGNEALSVMGNQTKQQRLLALAKDNDSYNRAMQQLADEKAMFETKTRTMGGPATAGRFVEDNAGKSDHGGGSIMALAGNALLHGEPATALGLGALRYAGRYLGQVFGNGANVSPEVNQAAARLLLSRDPSALLGRMTPYESLGNGPGLLGQNRPTIGLLGR